MKGNQEDTPPSSINGDEITSMDEDGIIYLDEMEEVQFEDLLDGEEDYSETEPPEDHSVFVFDKHIGSVFCCNIHPNGKLAVTGGEDDRAYVWAIETGQVVMECDGHNDSVIFTEFSSDGSYLATGDMSGIVKVWKCNIEDNQQQPWPIVFEYEVDDITFGLWHFGAKVLIIGTVTGDIFIFKIPSGVTKVLQGFSIKAECGKVCSQDYYYF